MRGFCANLYKAVRRGGAYDFRGQKMTVKKDSGIASDGRATVIGSGRWGSFIAWYLRSIGREVMIYGRGDSENFQRFCRERGNGYVRFGEGVSFTSDLKQALRFSNEIFISISAQHLRSLMKNIAEAGLPEGSVLLLCMKGLEESTGERLSSIASKELGSQKQDIAVWVGPGHVQDFLAGKPNCMVIDSADFNLTCRMTEELGSRLIRFYRGDDLIGNEIGAAAKNVIGIAAGVLDGMGMTALKGALMSRGAREVGRLIAAMGGREITAYGLAHLGDYEATLFSPFSHNRAYGESLAKGEKYAALAEGVATCRAIKVLSDKTGVEMPICSALYKVLFESADLEQAMGALFLRDVKKEFWDEKA